MLVPVSGDRGGYRWDPITKITQKNYTGDVYSLAVPDGEHYVADGILTHNCLYGWVKGKGRPGFYGTRNQGTVWDVPRERGEGRKTEHPTQKPVELFARAINNSTRPGQIVLDPFGGSGSSLIAAAHTGRIARTLEISPVFADLIRRRWTRYAEKNGLVVGSGGLDG